MGEALLDPLTHDRRIADLVRRVELLEQGPQVVAPSGMGTWLPILAAPSTDWYGQFTNAAYGANLWRASPARIPTRAVYVTVTWRTPAATTGEVQLTANGGALTTPARALAAASSGTLTWRWLHNGALWGTPYTFDLGVRRTGGAGVVEVQVPNGWFVEPSAATLTGV